MNIRSKLPEVGTTIFTVMSALAKEHDAINLSQGFPDYEIDQVLKDLVNYHVQAGRNQYAPMIGVEALRKQLTIKLEYLYDAKCDTQNEITITNGATEAIYSSIAALINPGDEVILFEPGYDSYRPAVKVHGGVVVPVRLYAPDYSIDWEAVGRLISDRTRMIVINTPHNPTGTVLEEQDMLALSKLVEGTDIFILSDEVYQHLTYDGIQHQSVLRYPELRLRSIVTMSFGKTFHATGWRIGYCIAPPEVSAEMRKVHQFNTFSINAPLQYALADYLKDKERYLSLNNFFQSKRDLFIHHLEDSKFEIIPSKGTYFVLARYNQISDESDVSFARKMTIDYGVAVIPISVFYSNDTDERIIRFCFAKEDKTLIRATKKLCEI
jgi:methionine aminotransferase